MKKYKVLMLLLFLVACANDPMLETRDELEIRKTETAEQTFLRQNETISAIKKQISSKQIQQQIRLEIPDTCKEVNNQMEPFLEKLTTIATSLEKGQAIIEKASSQSMCTFCRSNDYNEYMKISEGIEEQMKALIETKYLGVSFFSNLDDEEKKYIRRISQLCVKNDTKKQFDFIGNKFSNNSSNNQTNENALKEFENAIDNVKKQCDEYNLSNLKKARQAIQKKYQTIKNNPLIVAAEDECRHKFWGATSKQCSCYTRAYFDEMKELELKVISEKEQCRVYHDDFAVFRVESAARKKCGL